MEYQHNSNPAMRAVPVHTGWWVATETFPIIRVRAIERSRNAGPQSCSANNVSAIERAGKMNSRSALVM